jgi:nitrite reductase/ring-hydroxylating ferredoxin subunit
MRTRSRTLVVLAGVALFGILYSCDGFVVSPALRQGSSMLRGTGVAAGSSADQDEVKGSVLGTAASAMGAACGLAAAAALISRGRRPSKTAARYTTQKILPALSWIKAGLKLSDLAPRELKAKNLGGTDVLVGKTESGSLFCVGNLCPHIGTPMSEGADVIGDVIVCPLHGSSFKVTTGELIDWCPSPPIIGFLTGFVIEKKNLAVFDVRTSFFGGDIEVLIDTNAKRAYEASYWKGVLDAQGKNDGTFY